MTRTRLQVESERYTREEVAELVRDLDQVLTNSTLSPLEWVRLAEFVYDVGLVMGLLADQHVVDKLLREAPRP